LATERPSDSAASTDNNNIFPGEILLRLAADALDRAHIDQAHPLDLTRTRERFLPEVNLRGRDRRKLQFAVLAAAAQHGGGSAGRPCLRTPGQLCRRGACRWLCASALTPCSVLTRIFVYDNHMVTEEQIQKWADEAEAGYDVEELKRRGRGRPGRGAEPMQVVAVRLTAEELEALDAAAAKNDMSRSEVIRAALAHFAA
jgi:hypothetical protein